MLNYLNKMVATIEGIPNNSGIRRGLSSNEQFYEGLSELETAYAFASAAARQIILEPHVGTKRLDLQATIDGSSVLFETISPETFRGLKYSSGAVFLPNRVRDKIYDEFKKHLSRLPTSVKIPIVIIIDIGRSEIDYEFVADYLWGTLQLTYRIDKRTGKEAGSLWTRAKDSMHELAKKSHENLDIISGVICYKSFLSNDGEFHLQGMYFPNPNALNPLTKNQVSRLKAIMFK